MYYRNQMIIWLVVPDELLLSRARLRNSSIQI
jgi:hypothetical protein